MKINTKQSLIAFAICLFASSSIYAQFEESAKLVSDVRKDYAEFGSAVDIMDNLAVVGASREDTASGAAYIYEKDEFGNWALIQSLQAFDSNPMAEYGGGIKISEDYLVVASGRADIETSIRAGALYVYENDGTNNWEYTTKIIASDYSGEAKLGMNATGLDLQGNTIVCGAPGDDSWKGSLYIFENEAGVWSENQKVTLDVQEDFEAFGISVAISGDYIVAGASESDGLMGSAHVFKKDTDGLWSHLQEINASDGSAGDFFGSSVSIDGDYLVVGAYGENTTTGAAYIFKKDSLDAWNEIQKITASSASEYAHFGWACEMEGDNIVIASPHAYASTLSEIHVFSMDEEGVWNESQQIQSSDVSAEDTFGWSVAMHNNQLIAGATNEDHDENGENELTRSGSAYIFNDASIIDAISENNITRTFSIFPVPASDNLTIETAGDEVSEVLLITQLGKTVLSEKISFEGFYSLDLSAVSEGIYFVKLIYKDGQTATMKMVKSN